MANEFQLMPNPDSVPAGVTTGYQRQNTNMYAIQTGIDTTEPYDNGNGVITIPAGGIVEVNGVIFKLTSQVTLTKGTTSRAYWISIIDNGNNTASTELATRPGTWNASKQGCYTTNNRRTLNWVSLGTIQSAPTTNATFSETTKGDYTKNLQKGWYYATLRSGLGGGGGGTGASGSGGGGAGGAGGVPSLYKSATINFFHNGGKLLRIKVGGSGGNGGSGGSSTSDMNGNTGAGGGGGGGSGEATSIDGLISTGEQRGGNGGNGGSGTGAGSQGAGGGSWEIGGSGSEDGSTKGGGTNGGGVGQNGGTTCGGGAGVKGSSQADGSAGGYCQIYSLTN